MNIHAAVKFGSTAKNDIKVSPSHPTTTNSTKLAEPVATDDKKPVPPTQTTPNTPSKATTTAATPSTTKTTGVKAVDLSIAGTTHRINCPADEVANLEQASEFINEKIRELRRGIKGKNPSNEELLVLVCLELYDQVQVLKDDKQSYSLNHERTKALIEKIAKDARTML